MTGHTLEVATPLNATAWRQELASYPDQAFAAFLLRGISEGFCIGVPDKFTHSPAPRNLQSAYVHKAVVQEYLDREILLGRMQRLLPSEELSLIPLGLQISPFGVIPKRNRPDKWRLIVNMSAPYGHSANDAIDSDLSSISYTSIDDAALFIRLLGPGCLMAKLDLKEAYRSVPVHPADQPKLAVRWNGSVYIDRALPFGLRSAPKLFSALTDGFMWILHSKGIKWGLHYLDDFLLLGPANLPDCQTALATTLTTCEQVGLPVAPEKTEGPCTRLTFLGIEIDTVALQLRLPQDKLDKLKTTLTQWMYSSSYPSPRRSGSKRELLSLIGLLSHAAKVVRPGRAFIRNLINASTTVSSLEHRVRLNSTAREDIAWWFVFLQIWNGVNVLPQAAPSHYITSDASGSWGCGATYENLWLQLAWPSHWAGASIAPKELAPIVMATALWGPQWAGSKVCTLCDNTAVVYAVNKKSAKDPALSRLLRILFLFCAVYDITLVARHLPGVRNASADALSRNQLSLFFSLNPQTSPMPAIIPQALQELLFNQHLSSTSKTWIAQLRATLATALLLPLAHRTLQLSDATPASAVSLR